MTGKIHLSWVLPPRATKPGKSLETGIKRGFKGMFPDVEWECPLGCGSEHTHMFSPAEMALLDEDNLKPAYKKSIHYFQFIHSITIVTR